MKNKFLYYSLFLLIAIGLYVPVSYSQVPASFITTLANDAQTAPNVYEFDVYLRNTSVNTFQLYAYQAKINFDAAAVNGAYAASWVPSSNDAVLVSANQVNTVSTASGYVRIIAKTASSFGSGAIISTSAPGTKLGRFRVTATNPFNAAQANLAWILTGTFKTAVFAYDYTSFLSVDISANGTYNTSNISNPALPVELNSFMSNVSERQVNLSWETKTEISSSKFEIERAITGTKDATVTWTVVGTVPASGSSNSPKKYSYTEKDLQAGKYQYKLKMIDNNGAYKFSDIVETEVALPKNFEVSQNYPNPFNPSTRINYSIPFDSKVTLEVFTITGERLGQIVNEEQSAGYYTVNFSSSTLHKSIASGVYIYRVIAVNKSTGNVSSSIKKMILLK
jgi:hypothetical protein